MPILNKLANGLILEEDFKKSSLIWTPSPAGYKGMYFKEYGMRMVYTNTYKTYTIQEPQDNYMFSCHIDHIPLSNRDICGVVVMRDNEDYIECQSYIAKKHSYVTNLNCQNKYIIDYINALLAYVDHDKFVEWKADNGESIYPDENDDDDCIRNIDDLIDKINRSKYVMYQIDDGENIYPPESNMSMDEYNGLIGSTAASDNYSFEDVLYHFIRVVKKEDVYSFFASTDGWEWIEVGNSKLEDSHRIGFFMYDILSPKKVEYNEETGALTEKGSHFYVKSAQFYAGNLITIRNVQPGAKVQLVQDNKIITESGRNDVSEVDNSIFIDVTAIADRLLWETPQIRLIIDDKSYYYDGTVYPGDIYEFSYDLLVSVDSVEVNPNELFMFDAFYDHDQMVRIDFLNREDFVLTNLRIRISAYSIYYEGNETLGISLYDENETEYDFNNKVVTIDRMEPLEGKSVMIKLTDNIIQDFYMKEGQYRFKLDIY